MYATPALRGTERGSVVQRIQDLVPLFNTSVSVEPRDKIKAVKLVPAGAELQFVESAGRSDIVVPELTGYQMIEISRDPRRHLQQRRARN
jgi:hypothetical protein